MPRAREPAPEYPDAARFIEAVLLDERGLPIRLNPLHASWLVHIDYAWSRGLDCMILAPMGHGKTSIVSLGVVLYLMGLNPGARIKLLSVADDVAAKRVGAIKEYLDGSRELRAVAPWLKPHGRASWTRRSLTVERPTRLPDPTLEACGLLSTGVGGRCEYLVVDDPEDQRTAGSQARRTEAWDAYSQTWRTRLEPTGRCLVIGTLYHEDGVCSRIRRSPDACTLVQAISPCKTHIVTRVEGCPDDQHPLALAGMAVEAA